MLDESQIKELLNKAVATLVTKKTPEELYLPIRYSISAGGKRIRPVMCLLSYNLFQEIIDNKVLFPALGLEVFHGFTLIHDDIMDNAEMRRNNETVCKKWGANIAILSGDAMCIEAYRLISQADAAYLPAVLDVFNKTAAQVCEGQQLDMNFEAKPLITEDDYLDMIGLKTAVLIAAAAKIGAIAAGTSLSNSENMYNFAYNLGIAFQIQDDVLDTYGDPNILGKNIGGDIAANKKTFLMVTTARKAQGEIIKQLTNLAENKNIARDEKFAQVKTIFDSLGVKQIADDKINFYFNKAIEYLNKIELNERRKENILQFANELVTRNY